MDYSRLTLEQIVFLDPIKIPKVMVDDRKTRDLEYTEQKVTEAPIPSIQWSQKECTSIFDRFQSILANTNALLKSNNVKTIKINVGAEDDSMGPVECKSEVRVKSKEGASSSDTRIKLRVSSVVSTLR